MGVSLGGFSFGPFRGDSRQLLQLCTKEHSVDNPPTLRTLRIIFCILILTLEVLGGMNSVVLTDVVQCIVTRTAHKISGSSLGATVHRIVK